MAKIYSAGIYCGHGRSTDGSWDAGTTYKGTNEASLMLPIAKAVVKYLKLSGVGTDTDANDGNNINMIKQVERANKKKVDIFVSLHCDYYKASTGTMPLYVSAKGKKLANAINKAVMADMKLKTRGVTKRPDLYELTDTNMPACIFETGSIDDDVDKFRQADKYGKAIAKGICKYLGVKFKDEAKAPTPIKFKEYRIKPKKGKSLLIREGSSLLSKKAGTLPEGVYTIVEQKGSRGRLKSGQGWITVTDKYVDRV